ncbi:MAG TPA: tRNA pseudouridine(65) synthase TruC [Thioalkalivibrio sp.]|nr:tRNA pseudouridine(65) synthase TruC [Thioalkalivibrio sp.]
MIAVASGPAATDHKGRTLADPGVDGNHETPGVIKPSEPTLRVIEPDILFQDDWLVAIHKPAGLLVHRSLIDRRETRFALQLVRDRIGRRVYPVHRLDKPTSGALLFALDPETARRLTAAFTGGAVQKTYLAVVRGHTEEAGVVDYALREELDRMTDALADPGKAAQPAVTPWTRLATVELPHAVGRYPTARYSLLRLIPETGRKHQIRRHMKHIFHPVLGDTTHGHGRHNRFFRERLDSHRLLLAATGLTLTHPHTDAPLVIEAPLQADFRQVLDRLGWEACA